MAISFLDNNEKDSIMLKAAVLKNRLGSETSMREESQPEQIRASFLSDSVFKTALNVSAVFMLLILAGIFVTLVLESIPSIKAAGFSFLTGKTWDPVFREYGTFVFLVGTLVTSFLALIISIPFSLAIALFSGEYFRQGVFSSFLKSAVELLAGIPSVVYGFWALLILVPLVRTFEMKAGIIPYGVGILTASLILAVMIVPYSASIGSDIISLVPSDLKEAALSLGSTRFEMIMKVVFPYARSGICAGILLSLGRAIGETMAVTMVIGNSNLMPENIFSPANTMASIIANEFTEATGDVYVSSLIEVGLVLLLVSLIITVTGRYIINRTSMQQ